MIFSTSKSKGLLAAAMTLSFTGAANAAAPAAPADWSRAHDHIQAAERLAGREWTPTVSYLCIPGGEPNLLADPAVEPMRLFDNVYAIGDRGTLAFAIDTPDGIILIDALYPEKQDSVLLPGLKALGLDPARVKYVLITHGHSDHFGGAAYFQATYGARVGVSARDWAGMEAQPRQMGRLKRDLVLEDGKPVTLGGVAVTPIDTPGHTPGSMGFIFPVRDHGTVRMAAVYGSSLLRLQRASVEDLQQFVGSVGRFAAATRRAGVEVELQNHPLFDGLFDKAARLKTNGPDAPNPFVVGKAAYQRFLGVMTECAGAALARRGAAAPPPLARRN